MTSATTSIGIGAVYFTENATTNTRRNDVQRRARRARRDDQIYSALSAVSALIVVLVSLCFSALPPHAEQLAGGRDAGGVLCGDARPPAQSDVEASPRRARADRDDGRSLLRGASDGDLLRR